jgi:hypothetical protein
MDFIINENLLILLGYRNVLLVKAQEQAPCYINRAKVADSLLSLSFIVPLFFKSPFLTPFFIQHK